MSIDPSILFSNLVTSLYIPMIICIVIGYPLGGAVKGKSQIPPNKWYLFVGFALLAGLTFLLIHPNIGGEGGPGAALGSGFVFLIVFIALWLYLGSAIGVYIKWLKNIARPKRLIMRRRFVLLGVMPLFLVLVYSAAKTFGIFWLITSA